ncbi:MAG: competence/damage-inducible protein A [Paracoccaceae bacterium]
MINPSASMLVIGDEILSGRTRDSNMYHLAKELTRVGIDLVEVRFVSDEESEIILAVQQLSKKFNYVFTSGGIGPTHDDITADAIGKAFDLRVDINIEAKRLLEKHYRKTGVVLNESRMRMARTPRGAKLIPNSISAAPGFNIENVFVMAGVPAIFQDMIGSVLKDLKGGNPILSRSLNVMSGEGNIAKKLKEFAENNQSLSIGSYPFQLNGSYGTNVVIRGKEENILDEALISLSKLFKVSSDDS